MTRMPGYSTTSFRRKNGIARKIGGPEKQGVAAVAGVGAVGLAGSARAIVDTGKICRHYSFILKLFPA